MRVILRQDIAKLGTRGEIINVKDGFARNYLLPQGLAVAITKSNIAEIERARALGVLGQQIVAVSHDLLEQLRGAAIVLGGPAHDHELAALLHGGVPDALG